MKLTPILASAGLIALVGCAPAGTMTGRSVGLLQGLDGAYNVDMAQCGDPASPTRLLVSEREFEFSAARCTPTFANQATGQVTLACTGEGRRFDRYVRIEPVTEGFRMTDDGVTLTYLSCTSGTSAPAM